MSINKCPECGENILSNATTCPNCGYPIIIKYDSISSNQSSYSQDNFCDTLLTNGNVSKLPMLNMIEAISLASRRLTDTDGRSRRSEFWWWSLTLGLVGSIFSFIPYVGNLVFIIQYILLYSITYRRLHDVPAPNWVAPAYLYSYLFTIIFMVIILIIQNEDGGGNFYKIFSVNSNGLYTAFIVFYYFVLFIMFIFSVIALYYFVQDSSPITDKRFGPSPKYKF